MQVNAAKEKLNGEQVWSLLLEGTQIVVAQNRKVRSFDLGSDDKAEILAAVTGRTGNLRAPTLRIGSIYYVGFNEEMYSRLAG